MRCFCAFVCGGCAMCSVPPIEVLLCSVHNKPYISTLDLDAAYWLVPMHPDSVLKTGFTCMPSIFEWLVMPFSAKNAVTHFVHVIERDNCHL